MNICFPAHTCEPSEVPVVSFGVAAGFPSPAADYVETRIDLNRHLIKNPSFTFMARAEGDSMEPHIRNGDLTIVDRKAARPNGAIVLVSIDQKFCFKRLYNHPDGSIELRPDNPDHQTIHLPSEFEGDFEIFGRVLYSIHDLSAL